MPIFLGSGRKIGGSWSLWCQKKAKKKGETDLGAEIEKKTKKVAIDVPVGAKKRGKWAKAGLGKSQIEKRAPKVEKKAKNGPKKRVKKGKNRVYRCYLGKNQSAYGRV